MLYFFVAGACSGLGIFAVSHGSRGGLFAAVFRLTAALAFHYLLRTAYPRAFAEDFFNVLGEDYLALEQQFGQLVMPFFVLVQ